MKADNKRFTCYSKGKIIHNNDPHADKYDPLRRLGLVNDLF